MNTGETISRYRILGPLGRGGMGIVYQAEDTRLHRPVALKFLPPESFTDEDKQRFLNEARAAARARHPNICPVYDIEEADGRIFIAMAWLEGETLLRRLSRAPLEPSQAVAFAIQIADGLDSAHQLGIVHRDIKSSNLMVSPAGHVSIMDFGLALRPGVTRLTVDGSTVGTPGYMSPEQAQGAAIDSRTDIWSLGVVLFEMLAGHLPFRRDHTAATIHAILFDPVPPVTSPYGEISPELRRVLEKALDKQPGKRWQTAHEMAAALKRIPDAASGPTRTIRGAVPPARRGRLVPALLVAGMLLAAGGAATYFRRSRDTPRPARAPSSHAAPPPENASVASLPIPEDKQLAVLPFQVTGDEPGTRTVADGMVEILTSALSDFGRFRGALTTVPANEVRRRSITTPEEARRVYGVNLVLTGAAQPAGGNHDHGDIQFTLRLVDAVKLRQLRSEQFVYSPRDPVAGRDQAIAVASGLLDFRPTPAERTVVSAGDTGAPGAYGAYLEGRGFMVRYDVAGNVDKAIDAFGSAIRQDPKYALAYAGLGEAYWRKLLSTGEKRWSSLAIRNAEEAVRLDDSLAIVHAILGQIYGAVGSRDDAIRELRRAVELAPNNGEAPRQLARVYTNLGRFDEAEALYLRANQARPTDWYGHLLLGLFYYQRERYSEAEAALKKASALTPDNDLVYRNLGAVYLAQGRYRDAIAEFQRALKIKSNPFTYQALGTAFYLEHRFPEATAAAETALDLDSSRYDIWGNLGIYYKWTPGNQAKVVPALQKAAGLARSILETTPTDYTVRANLAEYEARLGNPKAALEQIDRIPKDARKPLASNLAIAYELTGHRKQAIELIRASLSRASSLSQIRDDPDLGALWLDPAFRKAIRDIGR